MWLKITSAKLNAEHRFLHLVKNIYKKYIKCIKKLSYSVMPTFLFKIKY